MAALAHAEKVAEGHDRVGDLARALVDHEAGDRPQALALAVVDRRALDLGRGDQLVGLVGGGRTGITRGFSHSSLRLHWRRIEQFEGRRFPRCKPYKGWSNNICTSFQPDNAQLAKTESSRAMLP